MDWLYLGLGLVILVLAGDSLVKGAVNLALKLGIPALVVGLTVVAFGTSAPELLVSINAVFADQPGIALGNVVGSNIANVLLVLGLPALISAIHCNGAETTRSYLIMLASSILFTGLLFLGPLTWWHGLILLAGLAFMLNDSYRSARAHQAEAAADPIEDLEGADPQIPWWKVALFLVLGLIGLPLGADLLVDGATSLARSYGVSETVIGLTLVALGTSLPELAATTMAAFRRQADVAIGNVIGSNIFNLLAIIGITSLLSPIVVPGELLTFDIWVMLATSLLLVPFIIFRRDITLPVGLGFCALYVAYVGWLVLS
jgi:cation:H+ antiporter